MAYAYLDITIPDGVTQTGPEVTPSIRANQDAIADGVIMGALVGWNMQVTAGSAEQPTEMTYFHESAVGRLRETITWDANGNPEKIFYERSYDDGTTWEEIGTKNIAWSPEGAATAISWTTPVAQGAQGAAATRVTPMLTPGG